MRKTLTLLFIAGLLSAAFGQQKKYMFVSLNSKHHSEQLSQEALAKLMEGHLANIQRLAKEGKLLVAGPFDGGGGLFILNTGSIQEAKEWLSTDPGIQAERWDVEVLPYDPRVGSVCVVNENVEMVTYTYVRYIPSFTKFNIKDSPQTFRRHDDFVRKITDTGNVIAEGLLGERDGNILILRGEVDRSLVESSPGVQEGLLEFVIKKLWVGKGSFCE
ncbi:MAG: hypothetical protein HC859_02755 [Bacteroidia bacterium]|nr:hypothetical protein [Bacteroidia bacterium]